MTTRLFTSESVSAGHPDKLADQVSDAILDEALRLAGKDAGRVRSACETLVKGDLLVVAGEMKVAEGKSPDYEKVALEVAREIGYTDPGYGFDPANCRFVNGITEQSGEISDGVGADKVKGAGDQGMMFGYACNETEEMMPLAISLSHALVRRQAELFRGEGNGWLGPDAKSQVTVLYQDDTPVRVTDVVVSTQHREEIGGKPHKEALEEKVVEEIVRPVLEGVSHEGCNFIINPSGSFVKGGPDADAGLTGRKIIVDTYGGSAPHGGGAFSGKDPSKVDRSAAYAARLVAKAVVASSLASRALVQLSYAIGKAEPVSVMVDTFGTSSVDDGEIASFIGEGSLIDLSPQGIIDGLDLFRPIYRQTAAYGHFGRADLDPPLPWEDAEEAAAALRERFYSSKRATG